MAIAGLAYGLPALRFLPGRAALYLFVCGATWFFLEGFKQGRARYLDPEESRVRNAAFIVAGVVLMLIVSGPMLYWGFKYTALGAP